MDWFNVVGYAAAICMVCGYMPQAIYTIKTRETDAIAMPTFLLMGLGSLFFIAQGLLSDPVNWPLVITNSLTGVSSAIVFGIKMHNDYFRQKNKRGK